MCYNHAMFRKIKTKRIRRTFLAGTVLLCLVLLSAGCGSDSSGLFSGASSQGDIIAAQEVNEEGVVQRPESEETSEETGGQDETERIREALEEAETGESSEEIEETYAETEGTLNAGTTLYSPGNRSRLVYLILPSESGLSLLERKAAEPLLTEAGYQVEVRTYEYDLDRQAAAFDEAISAGAMAVICENMTGDNSAESIQKIKSAGMAAFLIGAGLDESGAAANQIQTNRVSCINELADAFVADLDRSFTYIQSQGIQENEHSLDEMSLLSRALKKRGGICIGESLQENDSEEAAKACVEDLIRDFPEASACICYNALEARFAEEYLASQGLTMKVLCYDGDREEILSLVSTGEVAAAIVRPAAEAAEKAAKNLIKYFKYGTASWNEREYMDGYVITGETAGELLLSESDQENRDGSEEPETEEDSEETP